MPGDPGIFSGFGACRFHAGNRWSPPGIQVRSSRCPKRRRLALPHLLTLAFAGSAAAFCPWDCDGDTGVVSINDFLALLAQWGGPGPYDFDGGGGGATTYADGDYDRIPDAFELDDCPATGRRLLRRNGSRRARTPTATA